MVQNIWIRGKEFANFLGLLCGGIGIVIIGIQILNKLVLIFGIVASALFAVLSVITIFLIFRDAIFHSKHFWVSLPLKG